MRIPSTSSELQLGKDMPVVLTQLVLFNEDIADSVKAVRSMGMRLRWYAANFPTPKETGQVPLPDFPWTRDWLHEAGYKGG